MTEALHRGYSIEKSGVEHKTVSEDNLHGLVLKLKTFYIKRFKVVFPMLNVPLLQARLASSLGLSGGVSLFQNVVIFKKRSTNTHTHSNTNNASQVDT